MNSYLISVPLGDPAPAGVRHSAHTQDYNNGTEMRSLWDCINLTDPTPAGAYLIGAWDMGSGELLSTVHDDFYTVRPLGNLPEQVVYDEAGEPVDVIPPGQATGALRYAYWDTAGMKDRQLGTESEDPVEFLYPPENRPFAIEIRHKYFDGNANPAWDGYGWRAEFVGPAGARDPSARAIGIYNDPECTNYWYTTGAFTEQPSEWLVDDQGDPLTVWATEYNDAFLTGTGNPQPVDHHHAVLLGSAQEGYETLSADEESEVHLYWEGTQPAPGAQQASSWVDTGVTVTQVYGAGVLGVTDSSIFAAGDELRIGADEVVFDRVHAPGIIVVNPHPSNPVGETIYRR